MRGGHPGLAHQVPAGRTERSLCRRHHLTSSWRRHRTNVETSETALGAERPPNAASKRRLSRRIIRSAPSPVVARCLTGLVVDNHQIKRALGATCSRRSVRCRSRTSRRAWSAPMYGMMIAAFGRRHHASSSTSAASSTTRRRSTFALTTLRQARQLHRETQVGAAPCRYRDRAGARDPTTLRRARHLAISLALQQTACLHGGPSWQRHRCDVG